MSVRAQPPSSDLPALRVWIVVQTNDGACLLQESTDPELARETYDKIRALQPDPTTTPAPAAHQDPLVVR